ncbi:MAG: LLM class flavin-dependent oxidoreductase [Microbacteriaceae bacterium]
MSRELHLAGFLKPAGEYPAGWRHPDAPAAAGVDFAFIAGLVRRLEQARFDAVFLPDLAGLPDVEDTVLEAVAVVNDALEPTTLLAALSTVTSRIGLIASASTSFSQPYTLARTLASLDHLSRGRAGWNVVTSLNDSEARNHGLDAHLGHGERYRRASEFVEVARGLWDSFDDDAFGHDVDSGRYFEPERMHALGHVGEHYAVAGPLNIARPPQGHPVIAQAGSSDAGRELAAREADLVFSAQLPIEAARAFYADVKRRAQRWGRDPQTLLVLPELATVVAPTRAEAEDRFAAVQRLLDPRVALADVEYWLGVELAGLPPDAPLPPHAGGATSRSRGRSRELYEQAAASGLAVRDLVALVAAGDGVVVGSPRDVADHIEERFSSAAADGFTVSFPWQPGTLVAFAELVVPELQRRGLFRREYAGATLRENLGLARPASRHPSRPTPTTTTREHR